MNKLIERLAQSSGRWRRPGTVKPPRPPKRLTFSWFVARVKGGCPRCGGWLYRAQECDTAEEDGEPEWSCLHCGARAYGSGVHRALRWPGMVRREIGRETGRQGE